jgi:hypothetical protein
MHWQKVYQAACLLHVGTVHASGKYHQICSFFERRVETLKNGSIGFLVDGLNSIFLNANNEETFCCCRGEVERWCQRVKGDVAAIPKFSTFMYDSAETVTGTLPFRSWGGGVV